MNRLQEIEARLAAIKTELEADGADFNALEIEVKSLQEERKGLIEQIEKRKSLVNSIVLGDGATVIKTFEQEGRKLLTREEILESKEYRSAFFKQLQGKELNESEKRAMTSASDSAGAAIPTQTAKELVKKVLETANLLSEITLLRVAGNITIATGLTRDSAYQHAENGTITASTDVLASVSLAGYEFDKLITISKTVQTMSISDFETWLVDAIYEDVALKIEYAIVYGSGTSEPGGLASILMTAGTNLISTTSSISYADICTLMTYPEKGLRKGAKFLCNSSFPFTQLAGIKDTAGRPIYVESMADGVPPKLMGRDVLISDEVNDDELYYGQFKKIFGNLSSDIVVESSVHSGFRSGSIDYRGSALFDCKVAAPRAFGKFKKN